MSEKIVLYFSGGSMLGVFGAGVATHLQDADIYDNVSAVYGASAGAFVGAYFLSRQTKLGSSIFYDDLTHDFISIPSFCVGVIQRFWGHITGKMPWNKLRDAFNVDYLLNVSKNVKALDASGVETGPIPLYCKLFDLSARKIEYVDARHVGIFHALKATVQLLPYTHIPERIGDKDYMDAANIEAIGFEELRSRHPQEKIILVLSGDPYRKKILRKWKKYIEGKIMSFMFGRDLFILYQNSEKAMEIDICMAENDPKVLIITPPNNSRTLSRTTDATKLKETYKMGISAGECAVSFIQGQ